MSDIHLNYLLDKQVVDFANKLAQQNFDYAVISGDIATSKSLLTHLSILEHAIQRPIYFVCGNHDFYGSSISKTRKNISVLVNVAQYLKYLPNVNYLELSPKTVVVGADGWYDASYGDWTQSCVEKYDWSEIGDFIVAGASFDRRKAVAVVKNLSFKDAEHIATGVKAALTSKVGYKSVFIVTHSIPFPECHFHRGENSNDGTTPWYTSKIIGSTIKSLADVNKHVNFTVLCGHSHGACVKQITNNLTVRVFGAEYKDPKAQIISFD